MPSETTEQLQEFHRVHGEGLPYRPFVPADAQRLGERMEPTLRELAKQDGWASYGEQSLWHCDPDDWTGVAAPWLPEGTVQADVVLRTGFGDLFVWDGTWIWLVLPHLSARMRAGRRADRLLGELFARRDFYVNKELPPMMKRARKLAGSLELDEIYNFAPALALGGSKASSPIIRVKAREALDILRQLAPIQEYGI